MDINLLILQIAVIFLPGIVWARLDASYAMKGEQTEFEFLIRAFLFGLTTYAVVFIIFALFGWPFTMADLSDAATRQIVTSDVVHEVLWALGIGLVLSLLWLYASTYKVIARILQKIGATKKYGDEDVWDFTFNSRKAAVEYIHFRDFSNSFVYSGWVDVFSETNKLRELVLRDVIISDFDGNKLFEVPYLYLARPPENIHIEFPYLEPETQDKDHG
jgi:hypothetical protein